MDSEITIENENNPEHLTKTTILKSIENTNVETVPDASKKKERGCLKSTMAT